jgi:hypothetical protein
VRPAAVDTPHTPVDPTALPTRVNRRGGDVEVLVPARDRDDGGLELRGTRRRVGLRLLWATPVVAVETLVLVGAWWQLPALRPAVLVLAALLAGRHLARAARELRGAMAGWLVVDAVGLRGGALGADLAWEDVEEVRVAGDPDRPTVSYLTGPAGTGRGHDRRRWTPLRRRVAGRPPALRPTDLPTELLLHLVLPADVPVALGDPGDDPREVRVEDEGFHVLLPPARPVSVRWETVLAVEAAAVEAGGRLARRLDLLVEVRSPGAPRPREELVTFPLTLAETTGLLAALARLEATLPARAGAVGIGTHELWSR